MNGRIINHMIDDYVSKNKERCAAYVSLGQLRYLSSLQFCSAVMGNSSSGIIEVPSFGIPTINIGDRQRRRLHADSVISCSNNEEQIDIALQKALSPEFLDEIKKIKNPISSSCLPFSYLDKKKYRYCCHNYDTKCFRCCQP